ENYVKSLNADKLFLNAGAFSLAEGITDPNFQEAMIKEDMIGAAKEIILLADSTKCGKISIARVCPIKKINKLITDDSIDRRFIEAANKLNVEVIF
ncbi:MAG: DeoR/GlpR transcriptional regulator, partial [Actinobacteria bacterium]|nr:DeoR/GlpR transcriptional regulator [Actinomycetota bacterium]